MLDYGAGSGVLAICAAHLGASEVIGVDVDKGSVEARSAFLWWAWRKENSIRDPPKWQGCPCPFKPTPSWVPSKKETPKFVWLQLDPLFHTYPCLAIAQVYVRWVSKASREGQLTSLVSALTFPRTSDKMKATRFGTMFLVFFFLGGGGSFCKVSTVVLAHLAVPPPTKKQRRKDNPV